MHTEKIKFIGVIYFIFPLKIKFVCYLRIAKLVFSADVHILHTYVWMYQPV